MSLDTLKPETYRLITGVDAVETVVAGIEEAVKANLWLVKVNMVALRGVNGDQIWDMIHFAR